MKYLNDKLFSIALAFAVWLLMGCQGATLNIPDVGTSANPLEKSGELTKSEVWAGKILITGDVVVPEGMTLTIQPNSIVGFDPASGAHQLIVHGTLYAEGEPERSLPLVRLDLMTTRQQRGIGWASYWKKRALIPA